MKKQRQHIEQYHLHKAHPEKLQFEVYDLNVYRKKSGEKAAVPHSHSYYQIIWFFEAGGTHTVDFKSFAIHKNTVLFVNKDQVHAFDVNTNVNGWLIHFNESFFMHSDVDIFLKYNLFNSPQNPCYPIDENTARVGLSYVDLIQKESFNRDGFGYEDVIRYLLKSFLINLERLQRKDTDKTISITNQYEFQFYNFKELLEVNYTKNMSIREYAETLHISTKTLGTITKSIVGKRPSQLIAERIILEAKRLLKFTSLQVSEIAFRLGFDDASYFVKYFKRYMNVSPSSYRDISIK